MKKGLSFILVSILALLIFSGAAVAEEHAPVTLEVCIVDTNWADAWQDMKASFEAEYPWITLESVGSDQNITEFISARIAANDLPGVIKLTVSDIYLDMIEGGLIRDLTGMPCAANVPERFLQAFTYNGILSGITQGASFSALYVNTDALKEAGWDNPPANWDEFLKCCADIQEKTDYAPLLINGDHHTICYMLYELMLANCFQTPEEGAAYETGMKDGTFDFTKYPEAAEKLKQVIPYLMTGSATTTQDDAVAIMAEGGAAMLLGGNWVSSGALAAIDEYCGRENAGVAIFPPFNDPDKDLWISSSTEVAFALTEQSDPAMAEAAELFINWVFEPENFKIIQNARGTVPVLTNMTDDMIVLPEGIKGLVPQVSELNSISMGYNLYGAEFKDAAMTALRDAYAGNGTVEDAITTMNTVLQRYAR
ncbi:MAG: ABC transporter substrate-binding protein [Clostridiales bacterium]|nr:ABC transporter substrate-binding protein [Clostridiales bacterium]